MSNRRIHAEVKGRRLTGRLHEEGQHISRHKDTSQPFSADEQVIVPVNELNDTAELLVSRCRKEGWRDQREDCWVM
jgi:hypothetical protein